MKSWPKALRALAIAATLTIVGCSNDNNGGGFAPPPAPVAQVEVLHASPDAPAVNVIVDGNVALANVRYKAGSGLVNFDPNAPDPVIEVEAIIPGGNQTVIPATPLPLDENERVTVIALGKVADQTLAPQVLRALTPQLAANEFRVRIFHAAPPNVPATVEVYVTAPNDPLGGNPAVLTFNTLPEAEIIAPEGTYRIRVTAVGGAPIVFDSGPIDFVAGSDLVAAAVTNTGPGNAPISLVVMDGTATSEILSVDSPASVRIVHASPDAPPVDVAANDNFGPAALLMQNKAYTEFEDYQDVPAVAAPGINIKVVATGEIDPANAVINADIVTVAGFEYTVYAINYLTGGLIEAFLRVDDTRPVATETRVRIIHLSPAVQAIDTVDIYAVPAGTDITNLAPNFAAVPFKGDTDYVSLADGSYDVKVVLTNDATKTPQIEVLGYNFEAGKVYTAIARDTSGGGLPAGLILLDDFL